MEGRFYKGCPPQEANEVLEGMEYEEESGALTYKGVRYLLIRPETVMEMYKALAEEFPEEAAESFYKGGFAGGSFSAKRYQELFGLSGKEAIDFMLKMGGQLGWGRFELISFQPEEGELKVAVHNSAYAQAHGPSDRPVCHFIRGVLAGLAEGVFARPVVAEETTCLAVGIGPCIFEVRTEA